MKEAIVQSESGCDVEIVDSPIPTPEPTQVVIKVAVSGTNPKDWKYPI
jgi:NADPH:quinone reductase